MNLLDVQNLHIDFKTSRGIVSAVRGVDFAIKQGDIVGIVGESGSGKTVTALSVLRLLPTGGQISEGNIFFNGKEISSFTEKEMQEIRGRHIGYIPQDPNSSLNPTLTIGTQLREIIRANQQEKAEYLLDQVGINDPKTRLKQYPNELSGGMRQRVLIAMALAQDPELIIADEPTTALDVTIQFQILTLLKKLQMEKKFSMLFITHDLGVVSHLCNRVLVMYGGNIVEEAPKDVLLNAPQHPYTQALLKSKQSLKKKEKLFVIPGQPPSLLRQDSGCLFAPRCQHALPICKEKKPSKSLINGSTFSCWLAQERSA